MKRGVALVDLLGLAGAAALIYGAGLFHPALGWMLGGGMALGAALWWTKDTPKGDAP